MVTEGHEGAAVGRHGVVVVVAADHLPQPSSLFRDWLMHAPSQLFLDFLKFRLHAVAPGLSFDEKSPRRVLPLMKVRPRKVKVSGLPSPRCSRWAAVWRPNSIRRVFSG